MALYPNTLKELQYLLRYSLAAVVGSYLDGTPMLALSMHRVVKGYTGPCVRVQRMSDSAQQDIGFATGSDLLDYDALSAFVGGPAVEFYYVTWYDQSGNGRHATAYSPGTGDMTNTPKGSDSVINMIGQDRAISGDFPVGRSLVLPSMTLNRSSSSVFWSGHITGSLSQGVMWKHGASWSMQMQVPGNLGGVNIGVSSQNDGSLPLAQSSVMATTYSADKTVLYRDNRSWTYGAQGGAATTTGAGQILTSSQGLGADVNGYVVYGNDLSATDVAKVQNILNPTAVRGNTTLLVTQGDSITYGYGVPYQRNYVRRLQALLSKQVDIINLGIPGLRSQQIKDNFSAVDAAVLSQSYAKKIYVHFAGTNDIAQDGTSGTDCWNNCTLPTLQAAKTAGASKIIVVTMLPRGGTDAQRAIYNGLIRSAKGQGVVDDVIDFGDTSTTMGANGAQSNTTYYLDGIHPNDAGSILLTPVAANVINPYL